MTYKEAIKILNDTPVTIQGCCSTREYHEVMHLAEKAMSKQIPKRPLPQIDVRSGRIVSHCCPNCKTDFLGQNEYIFNCCENCGQALDWEIVK